eukprot:TRINITY_DN9157_c0_g1_i3.p2 TRINITY_DN9157_c0_g1~~TRINITY_DN9157_c0_g1_i3.p2  ORF type:complete len:142 (+),score=27.33 TRINITY_DN9157_c0_g1_i3:807-1232(+)
MLNTQQCDQALAQLDRNFSVVMVTEQLSRMLPIVHYLFGRRSPQGWLLPVLGQSVAGNRKRTTTLDDVKAKLLQDEELKSKIRALHSCDVRLYNHAKELGRQQLDLLASVAENDIEQSHSELTLLTETLQRSYGYFGNLWY